MPAKVLLAYICIHRSVVSTRDCHSCVTILCFKNASAVLPVAYSTLLLPPTCQQGAEQDRQRRAHSSERTLSCPRQWGQSISYTLPARCSSSYKMRQHVKQTSVARTHAAAEDEACGVTGLVTKSKSSCWLTPQVIQVSLKDLTDSRAVVYAKANRPNGPVLATLQASTNKHRSILRQVQGEYV